MNRDEAEIYELHARTASYKRHVDQSLQIIYDAFENYGNGWMLSFSSGKDSVVLLDMLAKAGWHKFGCHVICSDIEDPPENSELTHRLCAKYNVQIDIIKAYGELDAWREAGRFFTTPNSKIETHVASKANNDFKFVMQNYMEEHNLSNRFMGLRSSESRSRAMNYYARGHTYKLKAGGWVCNPLSRWSARDIWAYIVSNDLEYLSCYDNPLFNRENIRNELTLLYSEWATTHGILAQYRESYPELFTKLVREFPAVRQYV